jgi:hypothetical protein
MDLKTVWGMELKNLLEPTDLQMALDKWVDFEGLQIAEEITW